MSKHQERQNMIRWYRQETGETDVDMTEVAKFAVSKGWPLPKPPDPYALLADQLTQSARDEHKKDSTTGRSYRVNHAILKGQLSLWFDIDDPQVTRKKMLMSVTSRREGMVADGMRVTDDTDHWNRIHPDEQPIKPEMDLGPDIEWRRQGEGGDSDKSSDD